MTHGHGTYTSANGTSHILYRCVLNLLSLSYCCGNHEYHFCVRMCGTGDVYVGNYANDKRSGHGVYTQAATGQVFDGEWENGQIKSGQE